MEAHDQAKNTSRASAALTAGLIGAGVPLILIALGGQSTDPNAGLVGALIALGLVASVLGIVLGARARREARANASGGGGRAVAGIVTGTIGALFVAFVGVVLLSGQKLY